MEGENETQGGGRMEPGVVRWETGEGKEIHTWNGEVVTRGGEIETLGGKKESRSGTDTGFLQVVQVVPTWEDGSHHKKQCLFPRLSTHVKVLGKNHQTPTPAKWTLIIIINAGGREETHSPDIVIFKRVFLDTYIVFPQISSE